MSMGTTSADLSLRSAFSDFGERGGESAAISGGGVFLEGLRTSDMMGALFVGKVVVVVVVVVDAEHDKRVAATKVVGRCQEMNPTLVIFIYFRLSTSTKFWGDTLQTPISPTPGPIPFSPANKFAKIHRNLLDVERAMFVSSATAKEARYVAGKH